MSLPPPSNAPPQGPKGGRSEPAPRAPERRRGGRGDEATPAPTGVAVVGAGYIGDFHLEVLRGTPQLRAVAVCDPDPGRARAAAERHGVPRAVASIPELAGCGAQVAHLCAPPPLHARLARELLELGLSVLVEKPLCLSVGEARELGELARARGLRLAVNHNALHHPAFARLRARAEAGAIGRIEHVRATLCVPLRQLDAGDIGHWMFRAPENIVFEQATHPLSQIHALIGAPLQVDSSRLVTRELGPGQRFHERWVVAARAERGSAELHLAFGRPFARATLEVLGSDGALEADLLHDSLAEEGKTQWLDAWNSFLASWRRGTAMRRDARRGFWRWALYTLGLGQRRDAFWVGMRDSIRAFHEARRRSTSFGGDVEEAIGVLAWCEELARDASQAPTPLDPPAPAEARPGEVVVLGASGFIGRRVVAGLRGRGVPTTVVVRRTHALPAEIVDGVRTGDLRLFVAGLDDLERLRLALRGARACVQLATGSGPSWKAIEEEMISGSLRVAEAARCEGVRRVVYVSSIAALDTGSSAPRTIGDEAATDARAKTRSLYARGKIAAEAALLDFHSRHPIGLVIARPGVVLGPGTPLQHSGLGLWVRDNHCVGWGRGEHALPLVLVDDVADALASAALFEGAQLDGRALNLATRAPLSAAGLVAEMARVSGRRLVFHPRPLWVSQALEVGKWVVKRAGGRREAAFPSYHDIDVRALTPAFSCETARTLLGWRPEEDPKAMLAALRRGWAGESGLPAEPR